MFHTEPMKDRFGLLNRCLPSNTSVNKLNDQWWPHPKRFSKSRGSRGELTVHVGDAMLYTNVQMGNLGLSVLSSNYDCAPNQVNSSSRLPPKERQYNAYNESRMAKGLSRSEQNDRSLLASTGRLCIRWAPQNFPCGRLC